MMFQPGWNGSARKTVFLASAIALFLELALIRWVSCEVRIFAYCKNFALIACFLGFGTGCLLSNRRARFLEAVLLLVLLCLIVEPPFELLWRYGPPRISAILAQMPGLMIFHSGESALPLSKLPGLIFALSWTVLIFFMLSAIMVPFGQITARAIAREAAPLTGYSFNVAGSLTGIMVFTLATILGLPPVFWFVPVLLATLLLPEIKHISKYVLLSAIALLVLFLSPKGVEEKVFWSPYQKLALQKGNQLIVNNMGYQFIIRQPQLLTDKTSPVTRTTLPYVVRMPPGKVLIVGAGTGNDAAAALGAGASSVTAVDIDPVILQLGKKLHPQKPYDDPRVKLVTDDARHFFRTTNESFDLIVFSHLDSHTVLSSFTNVRLDDYIYTVQSFQEARRHLNPNGLLYLSFWAQQPYVATRLNANLKEAFGHYPVTFLGLTRGLNPPVVQAHFFTAEVMSIPGVAFPPTFKTQDTPSSVVPSTDDWPFLPLSEPHIPIIVLVLSALILVVCAGFISAARPKGESFRGRLFWLGAAFMLLEVHNVSRLALCFGTTWQVNAWVIAAILSVILIANWLCERLRKRNIRSVRWAAIGLFISLAIVYLVPVQNFLDYSALVGGTAATLLLTSPIFFAAILFANEFAASSESNFALGWNILGGVVGGMAESLSYRFGIPSLIVIAAAFYVLAVAWPTRAIRLTPDVAVAKV